VPPAQPVDVMQKTFGVGLEQSDTPGEDAPTAQPRRSGAAALVPFVFTWLRMENAPFSAPSA
jgi:hypothetical protein